MKTETKEVVCRKCGRKIRVARGIVLNRILCGRVKNGVHCCGSLKLVK